MKSKKLLALLLVFTLTLGTSTLAYASSVETVSGSAITTSIIEGDSTVRNPVFSFLVPSNVDFAFNPFEVGDQGSQITSADLFVINKSSIPVEVNFDFKLVLAESSDIIIKTSAAEVAATGNSKDVFMTANPSTNAKAMSDGSDIDSTLPITYSDEVLAVITDTVDEGSLAYVLDKASYIDTDDDNIEDKFVDINNPEGSIAAFRFKGALNPEATWAADEATLNVVYTIKGKTNDAYSEFVAYEGIPNLKAKGGDATDPTPGVDAAPSVLEAEKSKTVTKGSSSVSYTINLGSGDLKATGIASATIIGNDGKSVFTLDAGEYALDGTTLTFNNVVGEDYFMQYIFTTVHSSYPITIILNDAASTTINLNLVVTN